MDTDLVERKAWWRRELRRRARPVDPAISAAVRRHLTTFLEDVGPGTVLAFRALPVEVDLHPLMAADPDRYAVPRSLPDDRLTVHPFTAPTVRRRWGLLEPAPDTPTIAPTKLVAVLVPGLAFDPEGGRLGRGRGYYDRFLPTVPSPAPRVGVTTEATLVVRLPLEVHDVRMTHVATERGVRAVPALR